MDKIFYKNNVLILFSLVLATVSLFIQQNSLINIDVSIHLDVAKRILSGEKLYKDIILTNMPFVYYFRIIPVYLSELLNIKLTLMSNLINVLYVLFCFFISIKVLLKSFLSEDKILFLITTITLAILYFILPANNMFGQKEHLIFVSLMPYIIFSLGKVERKNVNQIIYFSTYFLCAIAFCIKPNYLILWLYLEAKKSYESKSIKGAFNYGNILLVSTGLAYIAFILLKTEFYQNVIPLAKIYYLLRPNNTDMINKYIDNYAKDKKVNMVSYYNFFLPAISYKDLQLETKYYHLWPISGIDNIRYLGKEKSTSIDLDKLENDVYRSTIDELIRQKPSLLIIAISESAWIPVKKNHYKEMLRFDDFSKFMSNYELVDKIDDGYNVYKRID